MSTQTMSITQALAEVKLLKKRLEKTGRYTKYVALKTKTNNVDVEDFTKTAKANFQSFKDLLNRYNVIRSAIVVSNATASVTIGGKTYTIAEAVERKRSIETEEDMLQGLQNEWKHVKEEAEKHQRTQQERLDKLLLQELGKDSKTNVEVIQSLTDSFMRNNKADIIDPLGLEAVIRQMNDDIEAFKTNVDWVLSESNGKTQITISV
jgi:hypothetical protein